MSLEVALWALRGGGTSVNGCLLSGGLSTDAGQRNSVASEGSSKSSGNLLSFPFPLPANTSCCSFIGLVGKFIIPLISSKHPLCASPLQIKQTARSQCSDNWEDVCRVNHEDSIHAGREAFVPSMRSSSFYKHPSPRLLSERPHSWSTTKEGTT